MVAQMRKRQNVLSGRRFATLCVVRCIIARQRGQHPDFTVGDRLACAVTVMADQFQNCQEDADDSASYVFALKELAECGFSGFRDAFANAVGMDGDRRVVIENAGFALVFRPLENA